MKSIRFYITLSIMFISMIFLTGCKFNVDTQENLSKKPIYNDNEKILEEGISSYLSIKENFILPVNIGDVGKINTVNLDTNKENEIVAFKKSTNVDDDKENQVGFILLKKSANSDNYSFEDEVLVEGDSIEYANFVDLNGDGFKEIILLAKTKNYTKLYMFN
ncbi:MAG: hypothetical protein LBR30_07360, partial [Clostridioides sp.]|nr:hypothetical protein [Clostridioides sp.]